MKKLIIGDGLFGSELHIQTGWDFISRKKDNIDISNFEGWCHLLNNYDTIINCIAFTDTYSTDKKLHWDTNYKFVSELVDYCNDMGKKIIHISTDYVYTNSIVEASEEDIPIHGNNWYSYTKLLADAYIELKSKNYLICRGTHKPTPFPYDVAWVDQVGNFDYVDVIVSLVITLINNNNSGIYNVGTELKTMYDLAKKTNNNIKPALKKDNIPSNTSMNVNKLRTKELIISVYDRSYDWIKSINKDVKITVYRKGDENNKKDNELFIKKNIGRDVHTFFYHLYENYENLAEFTIFSQDYPFDHVDNYIDIINGNVEIWNDNARQYIDGCWFFCSQLSILKTDKNGMPNHKGLNIERIWNQLFNIECPNYLHFTPSGHFIISKQIVNSIPKYVYKKILELLETIDDAPWVIERLEPNIFITYKSNLIT